LGRNGAQEALAGGALVTPTGSGRPLGRRHLHRSDRKWALAFVLPYAALFLVFVLYPFGYALWMGGDPALYAQLIADPLYLRTVVNTLVFVGLGVNVTMFIALLLSGFFLRPRRWMKLVLAGFVLPWLVAAAPACVSFHWMLIDQRGLVDGLLSALFGIDGPLWLNDRWLALGSNVIAYIWKWLPFWTLIFIAGRMMIARDIYDAAAVDGATGARRFVHITLPLLGNLYLICTLLSTLWTLGDFTTVYLVSGGAPALSSEVLATLGFHYAFDTARPALGVAAAISALPVLVPVTIALMRKFHTSGLQP
jgi:multiple sugar transport system permease protein